LSRHAKHSQYYADDSDSDSPPRQRNRKRKGNKHPTTEYRKTERLDSSPRKRHGPQEGLGGGHRKATHVDHQQRKRKERSGPSDLEEEQQRANKDPHKDFDLIKRGYSTSGSDREVKHAKGNDSLPAEPVSADQ
jgi:hypothetical protein